MISISDIEGLAVTLEDGIYDAVEMAYGPDVEVIWPLPGGESGLFEAIKEDDTIVGIHALYPLSVSGGIKATGNITAGSVSGDDALSNQILYRLDDWDDYSTQGSTDTQYWVPAAKIVYPMLSHLDTIDAIINNLQPGSGGGNASWGTITHDYANLIIGSGSPVSLMVYDENDQYLRVSVFNALFDYTNSTLTLLGSRNLIAPANITAGGSITASGNITAGSAASGDALGNILYRLESWDDYTASKADWVPRASIVQPFLGEFTNLQNQIDAIIAGGGGGGSGTGSVVWTDITNDYAELKVGSSPAYALLRYNANDLYLKKAVFDAVFDVQNSRVSILPVNSSTPRDLSVPGAITAAANITAGGVASGDSLGNILYRLDDWNSYDSSKANWVPRASIVHPILGVLENLQDQIDDIVEGSGGGGGGNASWGIVTDDYATLNVSSTSYELLRNNTQSPYLKKAVFDALFGVQDNQLSVLPVDSSTPRNLSVPGSIVAASNITAGAQLSGDGFSNAILYRLDSWDNYTPDKAGWVPSAALVNEIRNGSGGGGTPYDDTELRGYISALQSAVTALEARPRIEYVLPGEDYPTDAQKEEGVLYVKLTQVVA